MTNLISRVFNPTATIVSFLAQLLRSPTRYCRTAFVMVWEDYFRHFPTNGKAVYREHYASVRALVPKERLLEYEVKEGWAPLCEFLGQDVPGVPFPTGNEGQVTQKLIKQMALKETLRLLRELGVVVGVVLVAVWLSRW